MPANPGEMLIDDALPEFDGTIIEHIVIHAPSDVVYEAARQMDFMQVHSPMFDALMFARGLPAAIARKVSKRPSPPPPPAMRLADMFDDSKDADALEGWAALAEVPGQELVFGAIGKVWQPDIDWKTFGAEEFRDFAEPDYAKVAVAFSVRDYGADRALLSYEARTKGTEPEASRKFLRYWWLVRRFVHFVMQAALATVKDLAEDATTIELRESDKTPEHAVEEVLVT